MRGRGRTFAAVLTIAALLAVTAMAVTAASADADDTFETHDGIKYKVINGTELEVVANSYSGTITIPETAGGKNVTKIGALAFENCTSLDKVTIKGDLEMAADAFKGATPTTVIMDKVTVIPDSLFSGHAQLTSVGMNAVKTIGTYAFYKTGITSLAIPNVVTIKDWAFFECKALTDALTLPASLETLGAEAFHYTPLTDGLTLSDSMKITAIQGSTFNACKFSTLTLPQNLLTIGSHAFRDNPNLETIVIPSSVTDLDTGATPNFGSFDKCLKLKTLTIPDAKMRQWTFAGGTGDLDLTIAVDSVISTNANSVITKCFSSGDWKSFTNSTKNVKNITLVGKTGVTASNAWAAIEASTPANGCTVRNIDGTLYIRDAGEWKVKSQNLTLNDDNGINPKSVVATNGAALPSFTAHSKPGHNLTGYNDAFNNQIIDVTGKLVKYADSNGKWNGTPIPVLKAQFTIKTDLTYTVKYQTAGGDPLATDDTVTGQTYDATVAVAYKAISGYNVDATSKNITIADGPNTVTFIYTPIPPVYTPSTYNVTLVNGPGNNTSFTATRDSPSLSGYSAPSREGVTFNGYWTSPSGGSQVITTGGAYVSDCSGYVSSGRWSGSTCTLYAQWTGASSATIRFDTNGASSGSTSATVSVGASSVPASYAAPVKGSTEFLGYFYGTSLVIKADGSFASGVDGITDGTGKWVYAGGSISMTAKWGISKTGVTLNLNGTTYGSTSIAVTEGESSVPASYIKPVKYGFVFDGYCTSQGVTVINAGGGFNSGVQGITDGAGKWIYTGIDLTLHAKWKSLIDYEVKPEGKITYYGNDGTFEGEIANINGKSFITFDKVPVRHGYRFIGWAETPDATEAKYVYGTDVIPAYFDMNLYAVWEVTVGIDSETQIFAEHMLTFTFVVALIIILLLYTWRRGRCIDEQ